MKDCTGYTIGLDIGDRRTQVCVLDCDGKIDLQDGVDTKKVSIEAVMKDWPGARVVLETGPSSNWVHGAIKELGLGHEIIVSHSRALAMIHHSKKKTDKRDAFKLAKWARIDPEALAPTQPKPEKHLMAQTMLRQRDSLVRARTGLINAVRAVPKCRGLDRIPDCDADNFHKKAKAFLTKETFTEVAQLVGCIADLTRRIRFLDRQVEKTAKKEFPETEYLKQVFSVADVTALAFVTVFVSPDRFEKNRTAGAFLGMTPALNQSGEYDPKLRITKEGNPYLRSLLVSAAHQIISRGPDSDLKRMGQRILDKGGKRARQKAAVAVARKLAVVLMAQQGRVRTSA